MEAKEAERALLHREFIKTKQAVEAENARLQRELEAKQAVEAENARLQSFEISGWVRELAINRYTEDEINAIVDIFVIECGLRYLSEVAQNSDLLTRDFFMSRRVTLGFASAVVKAISSLGGIYAASSDPTMDERLTDVYPAVHNNTSYKDNTTSNNNNIPSDVAYIKVTRRGAVISNGQSEVIDCDYFHRVSTYISLDTFV